MKTGIVVFAHGSKVESANEAVRAVAAELAGLGGYEFVEAAFLELAEPDLKGAIERLVGLGAERVVVIPYFLTLGRHAAQDLPALVEEIEAAHPGLSVVVTAPLDGHTAMPRILLDRVREGLRDA
jgi:sirohydrochlorin ferrochelatase